MTLSLPWRRAEPGEEVEGEREYATQLEWERPVGAVHLAPLKPRWTTDPPTHPGVWWVRSPGFASKVVQITSVGGRLHYSWTDIASTPVLRDGLLQWSDRAIAEPT